MSQIFIGEMGDSSEWTEEIMINGTSIKFKLDTGDSANGLPHKAIDAVRKQSKNPARTHKLQPTKNVLTGIGNGRIKPRGQINLPCNVRGREATPAATLNFYVTEENLAILGRAACEQLELVKRVNTVALESNTASKQDLTRAYADVFRGTGSYDREYHIRLKEDALPVIQPMRTVPYAKQAKLKETLDRLQRTGIIAEVHKPTDWVHNLVVTEKKDGSMRICLDPRPLNKAIRREHYRIPTPTDVQARLAGKQLFTVVDMQDAFWHVRLTEPSSYLCTFSTPWGRKHFLRMPFGIFSASEVLQQRNDETFSNIPNVHVIADDIIIAGKDDEEHDEALRTVMERARQKNVRFSPSKLQFKIPEVKYMGHLISKDGQKPDPGKIQAIAGMPKPRDRKEVERVLGMIKYLSPYIPHESDITLPLRNLIKGGNEWDWNFEHDKAMENIRRILTNDPVLTFFDVTKPVTIQSDASQTGLGACLLQENKPVAYASRTLTNAEERYAQIEKEMLAITYVCQKFHPFIYGKTVEVHSDHKPLETIMKKPLNRAPPRLQRMMLHTRRYDLDVHYVPGKALNLADTLSRAPVDDTSEANNDLTEDIEVMIHSFVDALPVTSEKKDLMIRATGEDEELQQLRLMVEKGWPDTLSAVPNGAKLYFHIRDEIHHSDGLLFKGQKIIIPKALRADMLKLIHESHLGAEKSKERARAVLYWPLMGQHIEETVNNCPTCLRFRKTNTKEPMIPQPIPNGPWRKIAADVMTFKGQDYLLVADYFSKFVEVPQLPDKTAPSINQGIEINLRPKRHSRGIDKRQHAVCKQRIPLVRSGMGFPLGDVITTIPSIQRTG